MTFDDDMLQLEFNGGTKRVWCKAFGIDWPPPPVITVLGFEMKRVSMSTLTDEQRKEAQHILRGAVYVPVNKE